VTISHSQRQILLAVLLLAGSTVVASGREQGRIDELPAAWGDLDAWSRYDAATDETELGLGLKATGADGTMLVAFSARLKGKTPNQPPKDVLVHASAGIRANASRARSKTLTFVLHAAPPQTNGPQGPNGQSRRVRQTGPDVIDLSSRLGADDQAPGAPVNFAVARVAVAEFVRIARCGQLRATVFGVDVGFRPDQLEAIRAFADRIFLKLPPPQ